MLYLNSLSSYLFLFVVLALFGKLSELELMLRISQTQDMKELSLLFGQLYDKVFPKLWSKLRYTFSGTIDDDSLQDAFQEGWKKVLLNRNKYNQDFKPFNWIFTIMKNSILDSYKQKQSSNQIFVEKKSSQIVEDSGELNYLDNVKFDEISADEKLYLKDSLNTIFKVLDSIEDTTDRQLLKLRFLEDKGLDEIAKEVNLPLSTVNYRIKKTLNIVKPKLMKLLEM